MEHHQVVAKWTERPLGTPEEIERLAQHEQAVVKVNDDIATLEKKVAEPLEARAGFGERARTGGKGANAAEAGAAEEDSRRTGQGGAGRAARHGASTSASRRTCASICAAVI